MNVLIEVLKTLKLQLACKKEESVGHARSASLNPGKSGCKSKLVCSAFFSETQLVSSGEPFLYRGLRREDCQKRHLKTSERARLMKHTES